jgi:N-acetylmuramoyl-L-alanine amidase
MAANLAALFHYFQVLRTVKAADTSEATSDTVVVAQDVTQPSYRVGIQVGHWKNDELPAELSTLHWSTGTSAGGYNEWEVCLEIAQKTASLLQEKGVAVDVLPATVPENYKADAFVALHADGNTDTSISGFKTTGSMWDEDGAAERLSRSISKHYGEETTIEADSDLAVSEDMTQYYAFNFNKFASSIDANTTGVIAELGYLTNYSDRRFLTGSSDKAAKGIAEGIEEFLGLN